MFRAVETSWHARAVPALFSATVTALAPADAGLTRVSLIVLQVHADSTALARVEPQADTAVRYPDPARTWGASEIRALVSRGAPALTPDELRALVARVLAGATATNPMRAANPLDTMTAGATGDFSFVRAVRVRAIDVIYVPAILDAPAAERQALEAELGIDFRVKEEEGDPYVDIPESEVNYRYRVTLDADVDTRFAGHLVVGATFDPPAFV